MSGMCLILVPSACSLWRRLEFLGDALLELLVVRYNWRHAQLDQEALTLTKASYHHQVFACFPNSLI